MNYYEEIKNEFINNEINKKVKNYLINRKDLETRLDISLFKNNCFTLVLFILSSNKIKSP